MILDYFALLKTGIVENNWYSLLFVIFGALTLYLIALKLVIPILHYLIEKSPTKLDNYLIQRKVFRKLVPLPSILFIAQFDYLLPFSQVATNRVLTALAVWIIVVALDRFLLALNDIYENLPYSKGKPIKGYVQILEIITFLFGTIVVISIIIGQSPWVLLSGLGAMTAVLMLIFKDTILSLVASTRITANGLIEIGDWVEMPQYGADGDVIDIALHNIQIQNWDKTITSIPTHKLLEESFKNWKGMTNAGGRRIIRNINIDLDSIKFCDDEMLSRFEKINKLKDYLKAKKKEIFEYNKEHGFEENDYINARHLTNIGIFRAYATEYLKQHPKINQNIIKMVRQLEPCPQGLPMQIYGFTNDTAWVNYEAIQADIFDHLLSILPLFELRVFQNPSGRNIQEAVSKITQ